jgi:hypothetical protein
MKKIIPIIPILCGLGVAAGLLIPTTCTMTGCASPGGSSTNSVWSDPVFVSNTALYVKAITADGVAVAVNEDQNAAAYCKAMREMLALVQSGTNYSPQALEDALNRVSIKELNGKYAKLLRNNLIVLYQLYWQQMVADGINASPVASKLVQAIIDGIDLGLKDELPMIPAHPLTAKKYKAMEARFKAARAARHK